MKHPATDTFADGAIHLSRDGALATILLNRPAKRNAVTQAMWQALPQVVARIEADETIRAVLVRGAGATFCAGADIAEFEQTYADNASAETFKRAIHDAQRALRALPRPTIALIEGACVGGGCGLALACDLRFASRDARFGITPARLGLAYSFADTMQLVEKVGAAAAKDILFSGRLFDAREALRLRLVERVFAPETLEAETLSYASGLAELSQGSIRAAKAMANAAADDITGRLAGRFAGVADALLGSADFLEGRAAFLERRQPRFGKD